MKARFIKRKMARYAVHLLLLCCCVATALSPTADILEDVQHRYLAEQGGMLVLWL